MTLSPLVIDDDSSVGFNYSFDYPGRPAAAREATNEMQAGPPNSPERPDGGTLLGAAAEAIPVKGWFTEPTARRICC